MDFAAEVGSWTLTLRPRAGPLERFLAEITLRGGDAGLEEMLVLERGGDRTLTRFESVAVDRAFRPGELETLFTRGRPLAEPAGSP